MLGLGFGLGSAALEKRGPVTPVAPALIARWQFDFVNVSGDTVSDVSGGVADGTLFGSPPLVTGLVTGDAGETALQLANAVTAGAAATKYMKVPGGAIPFSKSMTITWLGKNIALPATGTRSVFFSNVVVSDPVEDSGGFEISYCHNDFSPYQSGWTCRAGCLQNSSAITGPMARFSAGSPPNGGGDQHFAVVYNHRDANNWSFYRDGVAQILSEVSGADIGVALVATTNDFYIGGSRIGIFSPPGVRCGAAGIFDDVRIYNGALSADDIAARAADRGLV